MFYCAGTEVCAYFENSSCSYCLVTVANGVRLELNCVRLDVVSNCFIEMFFGVLSLLMLETLNLKLESCWLKMFVAVWRGEFRVLMTRIWWSRFPQVVCRCQWKFIWLLSILIFRQGFSLLWIFPLTVWKVLANCIFVRPPCWRKIISSSSGPFWMKFFLILININI